MPIRRRTLTLAEQTEDLIRADQLLASGVEIEISEQSRERSRSLDIIIAPPTVSAVCEFPTGVIGYAPFVRLVARSALTLTDCDISTVFDDQIVLESFREGPICRLGTAEYRQSEVLNHQIEKGLRLSRGQVVEGYILATGLRLPIEYGEFTLPFEIVFSNQFGDELRRPGTLAVLRVGQGKKKGMRWGTGLYGDGASTTAAELAVKEQSVQRYRDHVRREKSREITEPLIP